MLKVVRRESKMKMDAIIAPSPKASNSVVLDVLVKAMIKSFAVFMMKEAE